MAAISPTSNEDWRDFFEIMNDGIVITDESGKIIYINPAAAKLEESDIKCAIDKYAKELTFNGELIRWVYINQNNLTYLIQGKCQNNDILVCESPQMKKIVNTLHDIEPSEVTILLSGESGTGKDIFAKWIHQHSLRKDKPFIKFYCVALSETLLETELFGYEKGAFFGAKGTGKKGLAEAADGGILFLDEIGELPLNLQAKLLEFVRENTFTPVGGTKAKQVDVRIIAATNKNLEKMVEQKLFMKELYQELNIAHVDLPPLRERQEDVFAFTQYFLKEFNQKHDYKKNISLAAVNALCRYSWPGNVRELSNIMERLVILVPGSVIGEKDVMQAIPSYDELKKGEILATPGIGYTQSMDLFENEYLKRTAESYSTIKQASKAIGISESTLKRKFNKHGIKIIKTSQVSL